MIQDINQHNQSQARLIQKNRMPKIKKLLYSIVFIVVVFFFFINSNLASSTTEDNSESWFARIIFSRSDNHLVVNNERTLEGKKRDRVNILLLGMGGKKHEGGYLTDTIMLASLQFSSKKVSLISIPRDLSIPMDNNGWRKINNINAYAEAEEKGSGGTKASQDLSKLFEIPIDYYIRIDFEGFEKIVDDLGGIQVDVDRTFDDYSYPIYGREEAEDYLSRFEHLHFDKGLNNFDGSLALKYARSRHGTNGEASDFARARRQQKIIKAVKDKAMSTQILKPTVMSKILNDLSEHVSTNIGTWEAMRFYKHFKDIETSNIINKVIDDSENGLLVGTRNSSGAYVLVPSSGNFDEIRYLIHNIFTDKTQEIKQGIAEELPIIDVRNGTFHEGIAASMANSLKKSGFKVTRIANASKRDFEKSIIYDLTYGEKPWSLEGLKQKVEAEVYLGLPEWLMSDLAKELKASGELREQPDFILILGVN